MAKIARKLTDLVGNTPLMELSGYSGKYGLEQNIIAKLEAFNPAGSVKDRVALSMIEDAEARGALKPGATIIEPTSGNTGVGLAMVATIRVSPDIDHARNDESGTAEFVESVGCADCIDRWAGRDGSFHCQSAGVA